MEDTQAINWEVEEEDTERPSESLGYSLEPVGQLHIFSSAHGPEKDFPLYLGKNVIGRMPDCSVALPFPSISKQHAVIEILALDKAPVLQDCGSLNGTQILRPPKVLSPGMSHCLRDQELILFADLPCQYQRLNVPLPLVSRGPLTVEETPRVQGGTKPQELLLAENSEEEVDSLAERCVVKGPRTSPLASVVPESDEEGPSPAPDGPGPPFAFNLDSDTDEEQRQRPAVGKVSSAARRGATLETQQPKTVPTETQLEKDQYSVKKRNNDPTVERDTKKGAVPVGVLLEKSPPVGEDSDTVGGRPPGRPAEAHLERAQLSGFIDSDTDMEEEGIPPTPAVVPTKKRHIFCGVGTKSSQAPGLAYQQESQTGNDTDVEEGEAPLAGLLERSQASVLTGSNTSHEEEVLAALTLAQLKESRDILWSRDRAVEEDRAPPAALLKRSQTPVVRDRDTDVEEEGIPVEKRGTVPKSHTYKAHSEKSQPLLRDSDIKVEEDESLPEVPLERSQASATADVSMQAEEEVPLGPAVTLLEKHQVPVAGTSQTDVKAEGGPADLPKAHLEEAWSPAGGCRTDVEGGTASAVPAVADVRGSRLLAEGDAGMERAVLKQERACEAGAQGESPVAQVEQGLLPVSRETQTYLVVVTGSPGESTQTQSEGAQAPPQKGGENHMQMVPKTGENRDGAGLPSSLGPQKKERLEDSEDLYLQATQCFVERQDESREVQSTEDEPTQAFLFSLPQEAGPSCCHFQAPDVLEEPWEVLATQPFCPREFEASEPQPNAVHLDIHGSCPSPPGATPQNQHPESPVHAEPLGREMQTVKKDMGIPGERAERAVPERGPLERETQELPPEGERTDVMGEEELPMGIQAKEQKQVLARDTQEQESDQKVERASTERDMESLKVESETLKEIQEKQREKQVLAREVCEREAEKLPERDGEPGRLEVKETKVILQRGTQKGDTEGGSHVQKGQASSPTPEPAAGAGDLQGLSSALVASGSQSGGGGGAPVSPRRQRRGHLTCKMPPAEKASRGDQESPDACLRPSMLKAAAPQQNPPISQSQKRPAPQPLLSPSPPSLEPPIPKARKKGSQQVPETSLSSELEPLHPKKRKVRPQASSRTTPSPVSSVALEPQPATPTYHPLSPTPTSQVTRNRTYRSSEMTPAPVVPLALELQSSTFTDQPVTPMPISWAARTRRSSVKTPESVVPTIPEPQPSTSRDPPVTAPSRGSTHKSVKTPEPVVPTGPEFQTSIRTDQLVTPELTFRATQGRTLRSSAKTPEPIVPTGPEFQLSTSTDQPVTPKLTSWATRGRTHRSAKTPKPVVPTGPVLQHSTSTDQPVTPKPTSRGRTQRSVKTPGPIIPTAPELQASTPTDQPITPELTSRATRGRTHRSSAKTLEPTVPPAPELQPSTSIDQPVTPEPTSQATRGKTRRPSIKSPQPMEPTATHLEPPTFTEQFVALKAIAQGGQSKTLRSSTISAVPVPITSELQSPVHTGQPIPPKPIPQANCSRRPRATRKHGSLTAPVVPEPCSVPAEPNSCSRSQRRGAMRAAESLRTTPDPAFAQLPEAPIHAPQMPKVEAAGRYGATPEPQSKSSQSRKRPLAIGDLETPLQKRLQTSEVPKKIAFLKEEEEDPTERPVKEEDVVIPGPGKIKKDQEEQEPLKGIPSRSLRRTKPNQESTAPKVLFTGVVDARGERAVLALGGSLASSVAEASHLVTDRICRTVKFLCALGRGIPILSLDWLHQSRKAGCFLPPDEYVVTDPEQEKNFGFSLRDALSRARKRRLLEGYEIHVTPGVQPPPPQMGEIISCCGGTVLPSMPRSYKPQRVVITCSQDFPRCSTPCRVGLPVLSPEFLLTGVLKQEAKPEAFVLSTLKTST